MPYQVFAAADGELMVAAANDRLFATLCEVVAEPELAADERFATNPLRVANRDALLRLLDERFRTRPVAEWLERLVAAGVPAAPVNDVAAVAQHEQTIALGLLQPLGDRTAVGVPLSLDGDRVPLSSPPPRLGEHSEEVLRDAGYSAADIAALIEEGVVGGGRNRRRERDAGAPRRARVTLCYLGLSALTR